MERGKEGFKPTVEKGARYLAGGVLVLAGVISAGLGNLVVAAAEIFTGLVVLPKNPKTAS